MADKAVFGDAFTTDGRIDLQGAKLNSLRLVSLDVPDLDMSGATIGTLEVLGRLPALGNVAGWSVGAIKVHDQRPTSDGTYDLDGRQPTRQEVLTWLATQRSVQPLMAIADTYENSGEYSVATRLRFSSATKSAGRSGLLPRLVIGHGYFPSRALWWLVGILFISGVLATYLAPSFSTTTTSSIAHALTVATGSTAHTQPNVGFPIAADNCTAEWPIPCFQPWMYAVSVALPAVSLDQPWDPPARGWATTTFTAFRTVSWLVTALFLAGITGLFRRKS